MQVAFGIAVELHEHKVPDFQIPVTIAAHHTRGPVTPKGRPLIDVDFRAGPTGPGLPHLPKIVLVPESHDPRRGHAHAALPQCKGLIIVLKDRDPQLVRGQAQRLRQIIPAKMDRVLFEIVAEREIAKHFKERMMTTGIPDVFQIIMFTPGSHAPLNGHGPGIRTPFFSQKHALELVHTRVGEQERRIGLGQQRRAGNHGMVSGTEKIQERLSKLIGGQGHREDRIL